MNFKHLEGAANALSSAIKAGSFVPAPFSHRKTKGFTIYSTVDYANILALRKINDTIRRLYRIKQSDRSAIVRQVSLLLAESTPKSVLRLDFKSFYDSIDRNRLLGSLQQNHLLSHTTKKLLYEFFSVGFPGLGNGLPRGACVSATLAEYAMREFDATVRSIDGVYYYARYVDDVVIFTVNNPYELFTHIEKLLPRGMRLNKSKTTAPFKVQDCRCSVRCRCAGLCVCRDKCSCKANDAFLNRMEFLGYEFAFPSITRKPYEKSQPIVISIAKSKLRRIKTRIINAFRAFAKVPDLGLLRDRIRFLTENHFVKTKSSGQRVKSGIYYNYRLIEMSNGCAKIMSDLDGFLRRAIFSTKGPFSYALRNNLTVDQRNNLALLSFKSGFQHRRLAKLKSTRMHEAKECWRNE
jgi:hypothetical protein